MAAAAGYVAQSCVLAIITILSVLGNGLVCAVLLKRRRQITPSSRFVLSLCSCDLAASLLVLPFAFVSTLRCRWEFGISWCNATAFLWLLATSSTNLTLAAVALERYFAIVKPLNYSVAGSKCGLISCICWILALLTSIMPFFFGIRFAYHPLHSMCLLRWEDSTVYSVSFLTISFLVPALVMLVCYGRIFLIACTKYKAINIGTISALILPSEGALPRRPPYRKPSWLNVVLQSPVKGFAVVCILLGTFFLSWTPYAVTIVLRLLGLLPLLAPWQQQAALFASLFSLPSHPFVYGLLNRSIRKNLAVQFGRSNISPQRTSTVGLLDYTPPAPSAWTYSLDTVHSSSEIQVYSQRKSSNDSGTYSIPSDDISRTESEGSRQTVLSSS